MTNPATDISDVFYIVDFDRTLADSDKLLEVFIEIANNYFDIPREQLIKVDADIKARGDSNDMAGYVRDHLAEQGEGEKWGDLEKRFIHDSRALNYLLPGATELQGWLSANNKRHGILTYGNPLWQKMKLTASGFNHVPRIVTEHKHKGRLIRDWQQADGTFAIPHEFGGGFASKVILIDDKAVSFADFPSAPSGGHWVLDPSRELPSQQGVVPGNVQRHSDLFSVIESL